MSDSDSLADLVADYSFHDNNDGNLQSSPFLEYTRPKSPALEEDMDLSTYLKSPPPSPQRSFLTREGGYTSPDGSKDLGGSTVVEESGEGDLRRNTSIQRRGQEYLSQFLARRNPSTTRTTNNPSISTSSSTASQLAARRKFVISPTTILLGILVLVSLAANIFLFTRLYEYQSPRVPRLEDVMSPGKVGETFDIFTPSTKWWQLYHLKTKPVEVIPIAVPSRATRISYSWRHLWETGWGDTWVGLKGWGGRRRRRIRWRHEERVINVLGRAQIMIYDVLQRVLGL